MALDPDIFDQAQQIFCQEALDQLAVLETEILALRQEINPGRIHNLMRASHSLKGGAASFGWQEIAAIAHQLESVFRALFDGSVQVDSELETLLLRAFDHLRNPLLSQIKTGSHECEGAPEIFTELSQRLKINRDPGHVPSAAELGVDIVQTLFEQEVESGIAHLEQVTADPTGYLLLGEWRAQLELLGAIGEMSGLPGFTALTQTIALALRQHLDSEQWLPLLQQALVDLRTAQAQVILGDRESGGSASEALLAWVNLNHPSDESLAELESLFGSLDAQDDLSLDPAAETQSIETLSMEELMSWASESESNNVPESEVGMELDFSALESVFGDGSSFENDLNRVNLDLERSDSAELTEESTSEASGLDFLALASVFEEDPGSKPQSQPSPPEDLTERRLDVDPVTYEIFTQEARDLLATIEAGLLELRQQDFSPEQFQTLMRAAHSIKGGAALVDLPEIKTVAHQLENVFQVLYRQQPEVDPQLEDLLLGAFDSLRMPLLQQIQQGFYLPEQTLEQAAEVFAQLEQRLGGTSSADEDLPSQLGSEAIQTLFESEIAPLIAEWQEMLSQSPDSGDVAATLGSQAELLITLGEMLSWIPLAQIGQVIQAALHRDPDAAVSIAQLAVVNLQLAQTALNHGELAQAQVLPDLLAYCPDLELMAIPDQPQDPQPTLAPTRVMTESEDPQPELAAAMPLQDPVVPVLPQQVVRVDLSRLERINNRIGELVTQENSLFVHNDALTGILRATQQRAQQFERFSRSFQDALDALTLHSQRSQGSSLDQQFDPLQLDRYSRMHSLMQEAVEEMLQLEEAFLDMTHFAQQSQHTLKRHRQTLKQVRDDLIWARMLPLKDLVQRFPRMVRDLASQLHKSANLVVIGADTLIDKGILEKLYDPLVHLIRNSIDHGIERPDQRTSIGKPPSGTIEIRAYYQGNQTCIEIRDDGNGIPLEKVIDKGIRQGLITPEEAKTFTPQQAYELLFSPGFSTASQVTDISGRGVGLDVVRLQVQKLKGLIEVDSQPQRGTTFTIRLPLTLTVARLLIMVTEAGLLAFPIDDVVAVVAAPAQALIQADPTSAHDPAASSCRYLWQGQRIPVYPLSQILPYRYPVLVESRDPIAALTLPDNTAPPLVLVRRGSEVVALQVDGLLREQELVIKPPSRALTPPPYLYGCSVLGDGRLVPVLDPAAVLLASGKGSTTSVRLRLAQSNLPTVLIADDSPTMRQTLTSSLRKAGYRVTQARDGQEALDFLRRDPHVGAVICDIEMPQMNGFEFLSSCRQAQLQVPVIMLTSRGSSKHRQLAQQLGAVDYLTKPFLEQELRATLQRCLAQIPAQSSAPKPFLA